MTVRHNSSAASSQTLDGMTLWCAVYDGPLSWEGRNAFEQIAYLEQQIAILRKQLEDLKQSKGCIW